MIDVGDDGDVAPIRIGDCGRISRRGHPISIVAVSSQLSAISGAPAAAPRRFLRADN
jgi:hypothetical protein